jgi:hypothetical protein
VTAEALILRALGAELPLDAGGEARVAVQVIVLGSLIASNPAAIVRMTCALLLHGTGPLAPDHLAPRVGLSLGRAAVLPRGTGGVPCACRGQITTQTGSA